MEKVVTKRGKREKGGNHCIGSKISPTKALSFLPTFPVTQLGLLHPTFCRGGKGGKKKEKVDPVLWFENT